MIIIAVLSEFGPILPKIFRSHKTDDGTDYHREMDAEVFLSLSLF